MPSILPPPPPPSPLTSKPTYANCSSDFAPFFVRALHAYHHSSSDPTSTHLAFDAEQLILVITKHSSGWWDGELSDGKRGWFPAQYVELIQPAEEGTEEGAGESARADETSPAQLASGMTRSDTCDSVASGMVGSELVTAGLAIIAVAHVVRRR